MAREKRNTLTGDEIKEKLTKEENGLEGGGRQTRKDKKNVLRRGLGG